MCLHFTRDELDVFSAVKRAFDPYGLLNSLKLMPALARCAEYGKMQAHHGDIHFLDIPRF